MSANDAYELLRSAADRYRGELDARRATTEAARLTLGNIEQRLEAARAERARLLATIDHLSRSPALHPVPSEVPTVPPAFTEVQEPRTEAEAASRDTDDCPSGSIEQESAGKDSGPSPDSPDTEPVGTEKSLPELVQKIMATSPTPMRVRDILTSIRHLQDRGLTTHLVHVENPTQTLSSALRRLTRREKIWKVAPGLYDIVRDREGAQAPRGVA
ncbi:hypothetical protein [Kitasatospora griseola]|uniref:hypothetical protein n=1 Tax=Kitasatospora griseola TaxID=2064 RepID=UPI0037FED2D8